MADQDDRCICVACFALQTWTTYTVFFLDNSAILFTTSTKDDRVHPGHARKMVKRIQDMLEMPNEGAPADIVRYYENIEGGHAGAADNKQRAFMKTLEWLFLWEKLAGGRGGKGGSRSVSPSKKSRGCCVYELQKHRSRTNCKNA